MSNSMITIDLIRKRSEHNDGNIRNLEELSLHQENIEDIGYLQQYCRNLKILLLQSNLIDKIRNVNKLKQLEYLNLAINNIETIDNLEGCESLQKLDLTLNFIGKLTTLLTLKKNVHLERLFLTGNPCTEFNGYREFVVAALPQLIYLDDQEITRSERTKAMQIFEQVHQNIKVQEEQYAIRRQKQKIRLEKWIKENGNFNADDEEETKRFWNMQSEHAPETRKLLAQKGKNRSTPQFGGEWKPKKAVKVRIFANDGRPLNVNESKVPFTLRETSSDYVLDVEVYRHLDTNLISINIEPTYIQVRIKEKLLQLVFNEDVVASKSVAKRSETTGHLVVEMPKLNAQVSLPEMKVEFVGNRERSSKNTQTTNDRQRELVEPAVKREYLEIGTPKTCMDFSTIARNQSVNESEIPDLV